MDERYDVYAISLGGKRRKIARGPRARGRVARRADARGEKRAVRVGLDEARQAEGGGEAMSTATAARVVIDESRCRAEIHVEPSIQDGRIVYRRQCRNFPTSDSYYCRAHRALDDSGCPICEGGTGRACGWHFL